jgi:hypothetical protein
MRHRGRVDQNQRQIAATLRAAGCTVEFLSNQGSGCPDICVGKHGKNYLFEVKNPNKPRLDRQLTPAQVAWHLAWEGQVSTITTAEEALVIMGLISIADSLEKLGVP